MVYNEENEAFYNSDVFNLFYYAKHKGGSNFNCYLL